MRLTLVISSLGAGGAERVMATMANYWASQGWSVTLLTLDDGSSPPFYDLHADVRWRPLGVAGPSTSPVQAVRRNMGRVTTLRRAIRASAPEVVVSFMESTNVLAIAACVGLRLPVVVAEHTDPAQYEPGLPWKVLRRLVYPRARCLVVLSETSLRYFPPSIQRRARIIPNPVAVSLPAVLPDRGVRQPPFRLVALGRLSEEKGYDLLIRAFARVAPRFPDWSLTIWGEGPHRPVLEAARDTLGLGDRVQLPGATTTPFVELMKADLFALSSRFEGFPMALCEAMACGVPVVSVDCPSGPREIIRPGVDGLLVPPGDLEALANGLANLMADPDERARLAARAPEVIDRFGLEKVMGIWDELLQDIGGATRCAA